MVFRRTARVSLYLLRCAVISAVAPIAVRADEPAPSAVGALLPAEDEEFTDYLGRREVMLGGGAMVQPKFEGSDEFTIVPVPFLSFSFMEGVVVDPMGLQFTVFSRDNLSFRLDAGYGMGRSEDDADHLEGLGDIDGGLARGGTRTYQLGPMEVYGTLGKTVGGSDGFEAVVGVAASHMYDQFIFGAGASATWSDDNYMSSYFGVTAEQSARSGLERYDAGAGFKRVDAEFFVNYLASEHWLVRAQVGVGYLVGDAADSPIVQDAFQPSVLLMAGYRF